jgi:phage portal protein BeeE
VPRILAVQGSPLGSVRSISLQDLPPSAWNYIAGHPEESEDHSPQQLFGVVPWLYRGVHLRAQALSDIPWSLKRKGKEISSWDDYNPIPEAPWVGKLTSLLYRTEIAICLWGAAYWQRIGNKLGEVAPKADRTLAYRWLLPPTVEPLVDSETLSGVTGFRRTIKGQVKTLDVKDCVYFWLPSVTKEIGAGESPAHAALTAAGLIRNIDIFGDAFFHRGALAPTILTVQGDPPQEELDRLQRWWKRVAAGVRRAWETVAVRQTIDVKTLGAPPKELAMPELTASKQKDVAVALGVPFTLLFSEASNHATARSDEVGFYTRCVIPES